MRTAPEQFALFGAVPTFEKPLHVGRPNLCNRESFLRRLDGIFERCWLTNNGILVQELESRIAQLLKVKHCIAMCNGTVALEIAARALGLHGEVIVPSFTFIATAHALAWQEITPIFCDIDPLTHNIDPSKIESMITPRTTGILATHIWGRPCPVEALQEIAERRGLKLLFDAAHAFLCSHKGVMIGNFGQAEVFSFHATKFFNTAEGGAVVTNDDDLANKMRLMKNFGFQGLDNVIHVGTNGKLDELAAAMGLSGLEGIEEVIRVNRENHGVYQRALRGIPGLSLLTYNDAERCNYQYVIVEVDAAQSGITRDALVRLLHAENIVARRYFYPGCHRMEPYRSLQPHAGLLLSETEKLTRRVIALPAGTAMDEASISKVCELLCDVIHQAPALHKILPA